MTVIAANYATIIVAAVWISTVSAWACIVYPLEYEYRQSDVVTDYEVHCQQHYTMPPKIKKMYYIYCHLTHGCLRDYRPIQCRTYPFEPHLENGTFSLVIEKEQLHNCPLITRRSEWRQDFVDGVFNGWLELLKIPIIKYQIEYFSKERSVADNIMMHDPSDRYEVLLR